MDKERLKLIVRNLEILVDSLKTEIYSDSQSYLRSKKENQPKYDYYEIFEDDDGYPDWKIIKGKMSRAKELVKLLERLIKQDHLYSDERIQEMKNQLRSVKEQIAEAEQINSKGFGKKWTV
jgi:hypothetical protein